MAENDSNEGKKLELQMKREFEGRIKLAIEQLRVKQIGKSPISEEGIELFYNKDTNKVEVKMKNRVLAIVGEEGFEYDLNNINKLQEELKKNNDKLGILATIRRCAQMEEQEKIKVKNKKTQGRDIKDTNDTKDNEDGKQEKNKKGENNSFEKTSAKLGPNAIKLPLNTKIGKTDTLKTKLERVYGSKLLEGAVEFAIEPDENDRNSFGLYVVKANGEKQRLQTNNRTEGKNAREEKVLVYNKDEKGIEEKQPMQIIMIGSDFGFAVFGEGDRYKEVTSVSRTKGDSYYGQVISRNNAENELETATYNVRAATDNTPDETTYEGDREQETYKQLENLAKLNVPDEINPAKDSDGISTSEVEEPGGKDQIKKQLEKDLQEKFGLTPKGAEYMAQEVLDKNVDFEEALETTLEIEEEAKRQQEKENNRSIMPGSAWYTALNIVTSPKIREEGGRTQGEQGRNFEEE